MSIIDRIRRLLAGETPTHHVTKRKLRIPTEAEEARAWEVMRDTERQIEELRARMPLHFRSTL